MNASSDLDLRRRYFAEELEAVCKLRSLRLVDAFARVAREKFLAPGPWTVMADSDFMMPGQGPIQARTRTTADADPARVYHNITVAIDPARTLFNGQPGTLAVWIDALDLAAGARVLHVGAGTGYYTAIMAHCVGPSGRIVAFEVDAALAAEARANLASMPWIDVRHGDASQPTFAKATVDEPAFAEATAGRPEPGDCFNAIVVNAGVTHPLTWWLDALAPGGRMILPLTGTMPGMGTIGKGMVLLVTNEGAQLSARALAMVAIYSAIGLRDEDMNARLGKALMTGPMQWMAITKIRRDAHEPASTCWLHGEGFCLSTSPRT
ncbi:MAG: methyltransferase domain-containing protein [Actinobacteria bacterium]|nr:MAG: methyltransferase domain-containing protein [Actinomycetota bacterium]